jgi:hypothetical protein
VGLLRVAFALVIIVAVAVVFVRVVVPIARRATARPDAPTVVPGEVVPDPGGSAGGIPRTRWHGYDTADVDALLDRVYGLAASPSGRTEALEAIRSARFHLDRRGGYEPVFVDDRMDAIADALEHGRDLPPRPDLR